MSDLVGAMITFAKVAEANGFSEAARRLGVSKSAVSKHVTRLEDHFGTRLLNRTTRRVSLTEAGLALYERCARIAEAVEEAEQAVSSHSDSPRGQLRVNAPVTFGLMHLAPAIPDFLAAYPDVTMDLTLNDRFVDVVDEGYDLAVRIAKLADSSLIAKKLAPAPRKILASPEYLARHGMPKEPADLAHHACLGYSNSPGRDEWRVRWKGEVETIRIRSPLVVNNGDVLLSAALKGLGIVWIPTFMSYAHLRDGSLVHLLPDGDDHSLSVYALYPHSRHLSPKTRAFVDFLARRFRRSPWMED